MTEQDRYPDPFTADPEPRAMALILILVPAVWLGVAIGALIAA